MYLNLLNSKQAIMKLIRTIVNICISFKQGEMGTIPHIKYSKRLTMCCCFGLILLMFKSQTNLISY